MRRKACHYGGAVLQRMRMKTMALAVSMIVAAGGSALSSAPPDSVVLEDFETDVVGKLPGKWRFYSSKNRRFQPAGPQMAPAERFFVAAEHGNKFLRVYTEGEAQRLSLPDTAFNWKLSEYPRLRWSWRAHQLPAGAREDRANDSGGAVYVSFSKTDWLGRPLSIKYAYSTSLPTGTVVSTGNVKIIVASSGADGTGRWVGVERDVVRDYRDVFGGDPPEEPFTITLWSDSDNTGSVAEVDFDDLVLVKKR